MEERKDNDVKIKALHKEAFNPATNKIAGRYENPFLINSVTEPHTYSFLSQDDPYDIAKDDILRNKWIEEAKMIYGEFKPGGLTKPISTVQKSRLMEIVDQLKKLLLSDWNDVNFVIGSNL